VVRLLRTHERFPCIDACLWIRAPHVIPRAHLGQCLGGELCVGEVGIFQVLGIQDTGGKVRSRRIRVLEDGTVHAGIFQRRAAQVGTRKVRRHQVGLVETTTL